MQFLTYLQQRQYRLMSAAPCRRDTSYGLLNMPESVVCNQLTCVECCVQGKSLRTYSEICPKDREVRATGGKPGLLFLIVLLAFFLVCSTPPPPQVNPGGERSSSTCSFLLSLPLATPDFSLDVQIETEMSWLNFK